KIRQIDDVSTHCRYGNTSGWKANGVPPPCMTDPRPPVFPVSLEAGTPDGLFRAAASVQVGRDGFLSARAPLEAETFVGSRARTADAPTKSPAGWIIASR